MSRVLASLPLQGDADTVGDLHHGIEGGNCRADIDEGRVADGTPHSSATREDRIVGLQNRLDELGEDGAMRYAAVDPPAIGDRRRRSSDVR